MATNFLLELLQYEENAALPWDDKLFKIQSTIVTTAKVADFTKLKYPLPEIYLIRRKRKLQTALSP